MSLNRAQTVDGFWNLTLNPAIPRRVARNISNNAFCEYFPFKLHISIDPAYLPTVKNDLQAMLDEACLNRVMPGYKSFIEVNNRNEHPANTHWSFTIYLHDTYSSANTHDVALLCRNIQKLLTTRGIPRGDFRQLTDCDLELMPNFSFRCSTLDLNAPEDQLIYCSANEETPTEYIQIMKRLGQTSDFYRDLRARLSVDTKLEKTIDIKEVSSSSAMTKVISKESKAETKAANSNQIHQALSSTPSTLFPSSRFVFESPKFEFKYKKLNQ